MFTGPLSIQRLLLGMKQHDASDLHVKVGLPPTYRVGGLLRTIDCPPLSAEEADHLLDPIVPERLRPRYEQSGDLDFATFNEIGDRFRVNMFRAGGHASAAIRRVKGEIPTYKSLHLPQVYERLITETNEGLILVVGVTGSGKSSTLAAMIEHINHIRAEHIITIEDPVEYQFKPKLSIISQRELGIDVPDYKSALRYLVRQDPDVVFIGEMRDHDTVLAAIQAAETGHLVFGSMHTADTMQSMSRVLEFFPQAEHGFIRSALANTLKAICAQRLLPAMEGFETSSVPATEVLLTSSIVKEKIREGEEEDLPAIIAQNTEDGMRSFTYSLTELVEKEWVRKSVAMEYAPNRNALESSLKGVEVKTQTLVNRIRG
ncbi:MAG: PilT/PilU family type 4a pilus ATPase [Phycisphaerales bacterium]|nr:PilT/PilU family type 4a pilus ATPase [Phycisphaerales bacterium]